jgi:putative membrane protein
MILTALLTALIAFGGAWWVVSPLFWLLIIVGIVFLVRNRGGRPPWTDGRETGIDVLERRFAEGELTLDEYRERRAVLKEKRE